MTVEAIVVELESFLEFSSAIFSVLTLVNPQDFLFKTLVSWIAPNQLHVVTSIPGNPNQESTFGDNFTFWSSDTGLDWKLLLPFTFVWREWILSWQLAERQLYKGQPVLKKKVCTLAATKNWKGVKLKMLKIGDWGILKLSFRPRILDNDDNQIKQHMLPNVLIPAYMYITCQEYHAENKGHFKRGSSADESQGILSMGETGRKGESQLIVSADRDHSPLCGTSRMESEFCVAVPRFLFWILWCVKRIMWDISERQNLYTHHVGRFSTVQEWQLEW